MENDSDILEFISDFYLSSRDFNGVPIWQLREKFGLNDSAIFELIQLLISSGHIDVMFGNVHPNPHIKAYSHYTVEMQLEFLNNLGLNDSVCVYPSKKYLGSKFLEEKYEGQPFTLELAKGHGQLEFHAFDLVVLEYYRNDPRYRYETDFIHGSISVKNEFYDNDSMPNHDQILLETFGFAYDKELNRGVAVFLRYLSNLSPEHQRIWHARMLPEGFGLHPDYYRTSILGEWTSRISIFDAFTMELGIINQMASLIGKPVLFRNEFQPERPEGFGFLLRPTLLEFNDFIQLLDKMLSDNINKKFFENDIPLEDEKTRPDGKVVVRQKGTISLLEEWFRKKFRTKNTQPIDDMFKAIRRIRQLRQSPAHSVNDNKFDLSYFKEQRKIMIEAYDAVRTIRKCLANHPRVLANPPQILDQLFNGEIWDR